jgi:aspartyl-tRNA(Asn)/glutamyl-tRNA(Gln) amidotransferase subunit B
VLDPAWIKEIEANLPELPDAKKARLQSQYGLSAYDAGVLITEQARADFFEVAAKGRDAKLTSNWVTNDLAARLTAAGLDITDSPIGPGAIADLVQLIEEGVISSKIAKDVFERMWAGDGAPGEIVEKQGLRQVSDTGELETIIDGLIAANPGQAEAVKDKPQALGWFVGQVMKATQGKANPGVINQLLRSKLGVG